METEQAPEAPSHWNNSEAAAWQSGWDAGRSKSQDRYLTPQQIAEGDKTTMQLLERLRAIVEARYKLKHGQPLTWERGWAWEALCFIDNELNHPRARLLTRSKGKA